MKYFQHKQVQMLYHGTIMRIERLKYVEFAGDLFTPRFFRQLYIKYKKKQNKYFYICNFRTPLIFRQPPLSSVANIFFLPFDVEVWKFCMILLLIVFFIMTCQLIHPLLRHKVSTYDVASFVWGAGLLFTI